MSILLVRPGFDSVPRQGYGVLHFPGDPAIFGVWVGSCGTRIPAQGPHKARREGPRATDMRPVSLHPQKPRFSSSSEQAAGPMPMAGLESWL